jgi:hypothetical protein
VWIRRRAWPNSPSPTTTGRRSRRPWPVRRRRPGRPTSGTYSYNLVFFGGGGAVTALGKPCGYTIGNIPDGASNTLGLGEQIGCYPASFGTSEFGGNEAYNTWAWPGGRHGRSHRRGDLWPVQPGPGVLPRRRAVRLELPDAAGRQPNQIDTTTFSSVHTGIINAALMDGSVRSIQISISQTTWNRVLIPDDGQVLGGDG